MRATRSSRDGSPGRLPSPVRFGRGRGVESRRSWLPSPSRRAARTLKAASASAANEIIAGHRNAEHRPGHLVAARRLAVEALQERAQILRRDAGAPEPQDASPCHQCCSTPTWKAAMPPSIRNTSAARPQQHAPGAAHRQDERDNGERDDHAIGIALTDAEHARVEAAQILEREGNAPARRSCRGRSESG